MEAVKKAIEGNDAAAMQRALDAADARRSTRRPRRSTSSRRAGGGAGAPAPAARAGAGAAPAAGRGSPRAT